MFPCPISFSHQIVGRRKASCSVYLSSGGAVGNERNWWFFARYVEIWSVFIYTHSTNPRQTLCFSHKMCLEFIFDRELRVIVAGPPDSVCFKENALMCRGHCDRKVPFVSKPGCWPRGSVRKGHVRLCDSQFLTKRVSLRTTCLGRQRYACSKLVEGFEVVKCGKCWKRIGLSRLRLVKSRLRDICQVIAHTHNTPITRKIVCFFYGVANDDLGFN